MSRKLKTNIKQSEHIRQRNPSDMSRNPSYISRTQINCL